jgi:hypothetical protein
MIYRAGLTPSDRWCPMVRARSGHGGSGAGHRPVAPGGAEPTTPHDHLARLCRWNVDACLLVLDGEPAGP